MVLLVAIVPVICLLMYNDNDTTTTTLNTSTTTSKKLIAGPKLRQGLLPLMLAEAEGGTDWAGAVRLP